MERRLAAILAADVVGYSRLMHNDEMGTLTALKECEAEIIEPIVQQFNGRIFKKMGDGLLAEFTSALDAAQCAIEVQLAIANSDNKNTQHQNITYRIGVNLGDIIIHGDDIFGDGVNIASRLEGLAIPGGVCVSGKVFDEVRNNIDASFDNLGTKQVKNIEDPIQVYQWIGINSDEIPRMPPRMKSSSIPEKSSVAVLPFTNMSADIEQEYFCDGISEDILNDLTQLNDLHVVARTSSFAYKGKTQDIREIGMELGAHTVVEGSVRKAGNRLRITVQLVDVESGYHLWSERYDRELEDVFDVQEEIAKNIVRALEITLSKKEMDAIEKVKTQDFHAYDFYLRGREFFHKGQHKSIWYASEMFTHAIEKDSNYALAYAGLADCYSYLFMYFDNKEENIQQSMVASTKAIELDPELAEAHTARGLAVSLRMQYKEAEEEFDRAMELNPNLFETFYFYARTCRQQGNIEKAAILFEKAHEIRPGDYQVPVFLASAYKQLNLPNKVTAKAHLAVELIEKHLRLNPDDARALYLGGGVLIALGKKDQAISWAERAREIAPDDSRVIYNLACIYSLAGRTEQALECIKIAIDSGYASLGWIENDSDLDPIRDHPRFKEALKNLN